MFSQIRKSRRRGSILVLTLFLLILLALMGTAFSLLLPTEMRNAQKDREAVQTAYGADAAVLYAMTELEKGRQKVDRDAIVAHTATMGGDGWTYRIESVEPLDPSDTDPNSEPEVLKVVTAGLHHGKVRRRATAIVDNGSENGPSAFLMSTDSPNSPFVMDGNQSWPATTAIIGDVYVLGRWGVDNSSTPAAPPFSGTIYQTQQGGNGGKGESYTGTALQTLAQYNTLYARGLDGVQNVPESDIGEAMYLTRDATRDRVLGYLFGTKDKTTIGAMNVAAKAAPGLHIPLDASGKSNGGLFVNGGDYDVILSTDTTNSTTGKPNSITTYSGSSALALGTMQGSSTITSAGVSTTSTFKVIHVTEGGNYGGGLIDPDQDTMVVQKADGTFLKQYPADFSKGSVLYSNGDLTAQGTYTGNKTIAATESFSLVGDVLKAGVNPGDQPTGTRDEVIGFIANADAPTSSSGFTVDFNQQPTTGDTYHIYASLMTLMKTDQNTKMFSNAQHPNIPNGKKMVIYGQYAHGPTNGGQFNTELNFIEEYVQALVQDETPLGWPTRGGTFRSRVRAYVDQPVLNDAAANNQ